MRLTRTSLALGWLIVLAQPTSAASESFAPVQGYQVYYQECGVGTEAVALVHDGVLHSAAWDGYSDAA